MNKAKETHQQRRSRRQQATNLRHKELRELAKRNEYLERYYAYELRYGALNAVKMLLARERMGF